LSYLLDTNIVVHARDGLPSVLEKIAEHDGAIILSALTLAELQSGLVRSKSEALLRAMRLKVLLERIPVVAFDIEAAESYGEIIAALGWSRAKAFDRMIAAHAISTRSVLVTNNLRDFADIPGLTLENWSV
jgi:tRNA(fMet)-specific endonuclease VapC